MDAKMTEMHHNQQKRNRLHFYEVISYFQSYIDRFKRFFAAGNQIIMGYALICTTG